jgi:uncharacterized membrane protein
MWVSIKPGMTVFPSKFRTFVFLLINWLICLLVPTLTILFLFIARACAVGWFGFIVRILALISAKSADKCQISPITTNTNGLVDA